jgi:hypothetical protein
MGTERSSPGVKRSGREADHSPPASAEVKIMWIYTPTPPYASMHRDNFYLSFYLERPLTFNEQKRIVEVGK